jgi:hypothetical protein
LRSSSRLRFRGNEGGLSEGCSEHGQVRFCARKHGPGRGERVEIVNAMLILASVTRDDVVYDLGCGSTS